MFLAKKHLETDEHSRLNFVLTFLRYQDLIPRVNIVISKKTNVFCELFL